MSILREKGMGIINIIVILLMLSVLSFVFKDNYFFKFTERLLVGVSAGYGFLIIFNAGFIKKIWIPLFYSTGTNNFFQVMNIILPCLLGLLFFTSFSKKYGFLAKYPLAFLLGTGAGVEIGPRIETSIMRQINSCVVDFSNLSLFEIFNYIIILIAIVTTMYYFLFIVRGNKKRENFIANIGIFFMMIGFGASFGYTIMGRLSLLIEVVDMFRERIFSIFGLL